MIEEAMHCETLSWRVFVHLNSYSLPPWVHRAGHAFTPLLQVQSGLDICCSRRIAHATLKCAIHSGSLPILRGSL